MTAAAAAAPARLSNFLVIGLPLLLVDKTGLCIEGLRIMTEILMKGTAASKNHKRAPGR